MVWVISVVLAVAVVAICVIRASGKPPTPAKLDSEQAVKAAVELYAIRRRLDVAWEKTEQRREGARLRQEVADAFDRMDDD